NQGGQAEERAFRRVPVEVESQRGFRRVPGRITPRSYADVADAEAAILNIGDVIGVFQDVRPQRLQIAGGHEELDVLKRVWIEQVVGGLGPSHAGRYNHRQN